MKTDEVNICHVCYNLTVDTYETDYCGIHFLIESDGSVIVDGRKHKPSIRRGAGFIIIRHDYRIFQIVHARLVLAAVTGEWRDSRAWWVGHKDGNPLNNAPDNLEWVKAGCRICARPPAMKGKPKPRTRREQRREDMEKVRAEVETRRVTVEGVELEVTRDGRVYQDGCRCRVESRKGAGADYALFSRFPGCSLYKGVARLVLLAFTGEDRDPRKWWVEFINGNDKDARLENLRWVSHSDRLCNSALGLRVDDGHGGTMPFARWCRMYAPHLPGYVAYERLKWGWSLEEIRTRPVQTHAAPRLLTFRGRTQGVVAWSRETGINRQTIIARLKRGWSVARALATPGCALKRTESPNS